MTKGFATEGIAEVRVEQHCSKQQVNKAFHSYRGKVRNRTNFVLRTIEFEYQLYRGNSKFPRTKMLTATKAKNANAKFVRDTIKAADKGKDIPIYSWKIIDKAALQKAIKKNIDTIS